MADKPRRDKHRWGKMTKLSPTDRALIFAALWRKRNGTKPKGAGHDKP